MENPMFQIVVSGAVEIVSKFSSLLNEKYTCWIENIYLIREAINKGHLLLLCLVEYFRKKFLN